MRVPGRVVVVGLGPAGADLLVPAARAALEQVPQAFVRTARHPAVAGLSAEGLHLQAFDDRYESATDLDEVYRGIVATLVDAAAAHGEVAYAVPGSPTVAERSVALLHAAATEGRIRVDTVPGLSFAELAWTRLGVDSLHTLARVVDGRALDDAPSTSAGSCSSPSATRPSSSPTPS